MTHRIRAERTLVQALLCSLALVCAACGGTRSSEPAQPASSESVSVESPPEADWLEPSPPLARQIEIQLAQIPWLQTLEERIRTIEWFRDVGEPAYDDLLALVADPRPKVAGTALAALGATRDSRLVDHLRTIPWPSEENVDLRLERSRAHMQLGDWDSVGVLVDGLEDPRAMTRAICARSLQRATRQDFGFDASAEEAQRAEAVAQWRAWAAARAQDPMLSGHVSSEAKQSQPVMPQDVQVTVQEVDDPQQTEEIQNADESWQGDEMQNVDEASDSDEMQNVDETPDSDEMQNVDETPDSDEMQNVDETPDSDEMQNVDETPDSDEMQNVDETPDSDEMQNVDETSDGDDVQDVDEVEHMDEATPSVDPQ
ncbi:MAG: hypothetical protein GY711_23640 [bacterium]|nr:hypothetical protein [bacterium]